VDQIEVMPGQQLLLRQVDWDQFEAILVDLGEHRGSRIAYYRGTLEIRMPLPGHERVKVLLGDFLKILLEERELDWESLGSATFKNQDMQAGIEPDDCFYIQNYAAVVGKERLDLTVDPPPDLAIEVDLTSVTQVRAYEALKIPEIWRFQNGQLRVVTLQAGQYVESAQSLCLPGLSVEVDLSPFLTKRAKMPMSELLREFRAWVKATLR
jgi:Uma2 family endonuclease